MGAGGAASGGGSGAAQTKDVESCQPHHDIVGFSTGKRATHLALDAARRNLVLLPPQLDLHAERRRANMILLRAGERAPQPRRRQPLYVPHVRVGEGRDEERVLERGNDGAPERAAERLEARLGEGGRRGEEEGAEVREADVLAETLDCVARIAGQGGMARDRMREVAHKEASPRMSAWIRSPRAAGEACRRGPGGQ